MNPEVDKLWYVVNTYVGHEESVKDRLMMRTESMNLQDHIFRVIIPETTEVEIKNGEKKEKKKKMFPGYVLVEMIMSDEAWYAVRNTPGVTGFIGSSGKGAKPTPVTEAEIEKVLGFMGMTTTESAGALELNDKVRVIEGPFKGMEGNISSIDEENNKITVSIDLFGQETPVEVEPNQVSKLS